MAHFDIQTGTMVADGPQDYDYINQLQEQQKQAAIGAQKSLFTRQNGYLAWTPEQMQQWQSAPNAAAKNALAIKFQQDSGWGYDHTAAKDIYNTEGLTLGENAAPGSQNLGDYSVFDPGGEAGNADPHYRGLTADEASARTGHQDAYDTWNARGMTIGADGQYYFNSQLNPKPQEYASDLDEFGQSASQGIVGGALMIGAGSGLSSLTGGEALGGTTGSETLSGGAGADTLGGETVLPGESATSGSAGSNGGGMWDLVDNVGFDPGSEGMFNAPLAEDTSTGAFDQFGMNNPNTGFQDQGFDPGGSWLDSLKGYGQQGMDVYNKLKAIPGIAALLGSVSGRTGSKSTGGGILNGVLSDPIGSAFNASPFLLAMAEANRQGNKTDPVLARLSGLADQAGSNEGGLLSSVTGPYNRQTMAGRDAMMSDQSLRGIRGSSFGDQGLTSYDTSRSQGLGELTGSTQAKSIGLQGGLLNQLLAGQTQAATSRNLLLGAGLNASGKLFQPQSDPFGLKNLLGG